MDLIRCSFVLHRAFIGHQEPAWDHAEVGTQRAADAALSLPGAGCGHDKKWALTGDHTGNVHSQWRRVSKEGEGTKGDVT